MSPCFRTYSETRLLVPTVLQLICRVKQTKQENTRIYISSFWLVSRPLILFVYLVFVCIFPPEVIKEQKPKHAPVVQN